ncbi:MAG: type IX secretion system sortase PorU [Ignavibacteria bacterium]|nr:type IX secretion system sortase PorU [Ignavibacteria bacterium]
MFNTMLFGKKASYTALALFVGHCIQLNAGDVRGLRVENAPGGVISFSLTPVIYGWDTVVADGKKSLIPHIDGARFRQTADATIRQWVVTFDLPVSGEQGFALLAKSSTSSAIDLELKAGYTPEGVVIPTQQPVEADVSVFYSGIARDKHLARVECVVVESRNGQTILRDNFNIKIEKKEIVSATPLKQTEQVLGLEPLGDVYSFTIGEEGVYRITAQQLRDAGIPTDALAAKKIHIFGRGGTELDEVVESESNRNLIEQEIIVRTNGDGSISEVLFYASGPSGFKWGSKGAEHYIHHYALNAGYLLTVGGADGLRSVERQPASGTPNNRPLTVRGYAFYEEELVNPYNSGSGRKWLGKTVESNGSLTITTILPGFVNSGTVDYKMMFAHRGSTSGTFTVFENGKPLSQRVLPPVPQYMDTYSGGVGGSLYANTLSSDGRSILRFQYSNTEPSSSGLLDWFEINYPRGMIAQDDKFWFFSDPALDGISEYTINGFSGSEIFAFDVTDRSLPKRVKNAAPSGGLCSIRENSDSNGIRRYFITSSIQSVELHKVSFVNLRALPLNAEAIVVTHSTLRASADRFAEYRRSKSGMSVAVVNIEDIFNEFSYGIMDPTAVRDFIRHALTQWTTKPKYVVLWGDGHYDYKGISTKAPNYLIPFESLDPDDMNWGLNTHTTDDFFVRVAGNDTRVDVAIGRLPITSNAIGDQMLEKIRQYEEESSDDDWRTRVGLAADDGATSYGSDGSIHLDQSESLAKYYIPESILPKKVYLVEYPTENIAKGRRKPAVTSEYVSSINTTGLLVLNWVGHGNPRVWAHELVYERETTPPLMTNSNKFFFLTAATCDFARFDLTETQSGGEEIVVKKGAGAIGTFSAARVVFSFSNAEINQEFYKNLFSIEPDGSVPLLGDVMFRVKQTLSGSNDEKFLLVADPTMRLTIPNYEVAFDTINGAALSSGSDVVVKALSSVTISGHIAKPIQSSADDSFNGIVTVSLLDAERSITIVDNDIYSTVNRFTVRGAALSRGSFVVDRGRFTATFVVPKDIAFSSANARLYGYAVSDDGRKAKGTTTRLIVDGFESNAYKDFNGPEISIYLDSRLFTSGDVVRSNPILIADLVDETGINTTGIGVGHDIEAVFDNGIQVQALTSDFKTSLESQLRGSAEKQIFGLQPGVHVVRVRAWDVLNNVSEAYTTFRIASADEGIVTSWVMNYPNPFSESTTVRFMHNVSQPFNARVRIYDIQGRIVSESEMEMRDMQTAEYVWNGRDTDGNLLGSGVYNCVVRITDRSGSTTDVAGKLVLIR